MSFSLYHGISWDSGFKFGAGFFSLTYLCRSLAEHKILVKAPEVAPNIAICARWSLQICSFFLLVYKEGENINN